MILNYKQPGYGYYVLIGAFDAQEGKARQVLVTPLDIYQGAYDSGYSQGSWNKIYFDQEWM